MSFPDTIDSFATLVDNVDTMFALIPNDRGRAITNIETAMGISLANITITGEMRLFSGTITQIPSGWLHCAGQAISRSTFATLFAIIGTTYGVGDGTTTFNIPDTRDLFIVGAKQDSGGIAKTNITGSLLKTGGSLSQPPITSSQGLNASVTGGANQNLDGGHNHTFTPPFIAIVYMIKT